MQMIRLLLQYAWFQKPNSESITTKEHIEDIHRIMKTASSTSAT